MRGGVTPHEASLLSCSASVRSKTPGRAVRFKVQSWSWMEKLISVINLVLSPPPVSCVSVNLNIQQS